MQYITEINSYENERKSAVTLGKFDALHRGHQKLIDKICEYADENTVSIVCAFDMGKQVLLTGEEKKNLLEKQVDYLISCPFTKELQKMEAEEFIEKILVERFHATHIVVGTDFHFGHGKRGDAHMLAEYAKQYGYCVDIIQKERYQGEIISSTYVREALAAGNIELVQALLGYSYIISGEVRHGRQLGRKLGFPTMNLMADEHKILPRFGVYTCRVQVDGSWYNGIGNVGIKPTVGDGQKPLVEIFAFGFDGDAYGKMIDAEFCTFLRPEMKFDSVEGLKKQVDADIERGKQYFKMKGMYK